MIIRFCLSSVCCVCCVFAFVFVWQNAYSQNLSVPNNRIENKFAVFSGIDKITARITTFSVPIDETFIFDKLEITVRVCYSAPPFENPHDTAFVEINSLALDLQSTRIFTGWMFAQSPGINGVEHPVNDVWLIDCVDKTEE